MALCIFNSLKRFSSPLNSVRLKSKYISHACFAAVDDPKPIPAVRSETYIKHLKNKEVLLNKALGYTNAIECVKLRENVVLYSQDNSSGNTGGGPSNPNRCSDEQLAIVFENLRINLPKLFVTVMDFSIFHPQLIFENNIQGKRTVGLSPYIVKISMLRMIGHWKYAYVNMEILKMTKHSEDSTIKIRWRISGISGYQMVSQMWKFKVWKPTKMLDQKKVWIDGFSTMYVGGDGKIFKHVADRVMPDQNFEEREKSNVISLDAVPKMALFVGLSPDISSVIFS